jgi:hypothetical protein
MTPRDELINYLDRPLTLGKPTRREEWIRE